MQTDGDPCNEATLLCGDIIDPHLTLAPRRTGHVMAKRPHGPEPAAQQLGQGKGSA
jgi:hypothetical protein